MKIIKIFAAALIAAALVSGTAFCGTNPITEKTYSPKAINHFPDTKSGRKVLIGDFHCHTEWGHGGLTVPDRIMEAWAWGFDYLAITEHGNISGAVATTPADSKWLPKDAKSYTGVAGVEKGDMPRQPMESNRLAIPIAKKYGLLYFCGVESGIAGKEHTVAFNISKDYNSDAYDHWLAEDPGQGNAVWYRDRFKQFQDMGAFLIYPHPHYGYAREQMQWSVDHGLVRGIEVMNGSNSTKAIAATGATEGEAGYRWYEAFDYALEHNLGIYANTDAHGERGATFTLVLAKEKTKESVMEACNELRTVGYFDNMLWGRVRDVDDIISSCVEVEKIKLDSALTMVRISNLSPMTMSLSVLGRDIELPPYNNVLVKNETGRDSFVITYKNVWTSSKTKLKKRY